MKRLVSVVLLISMPLMLLLLVAQSADHYGRQAELRRLERQQASLLESNRQLLSDIAMHTTRERIEQAVQAAEGLQKVGPANTLRIQVRPPTGGIDG